MFFLFVLITISISLQCDFVSYTFIAHPLRLNIICCYFTSCIGISIILINIFKHLKAYINFPTLTCLSLSLIICLRLRKCDVI